jgi:hypothetical protein
VPSAQARHLLDLVGVLDRVVQVLVEQRDPDRDRESSSAAMSGVEQAVARPQASHRRLDDGCSRFDALPEEKERRVA